MFQWRNLDRLILDEAQLIAYIDYCKSHYRRKVFVLPAGHDLSNFKEKEFITVSYERYGQRRSSYRNLFYAYVNFYKNN